MADHLARSRKQEKRGAQVYGGTVNPGSGCGHRKNDVTTSGHSIEFKTTTKKSYSLSLASLIDCERHALSLGGRVPLFGIDFATTAATYRYVLMTEFDYLQAQHELEYLREFYDQHADDV